MDILGFFPPLKATVSVFKKMGFKWRSLITMWKALVLATFSWLQYLLPITPHFLKTLLWGFLVQTACSVFSGLSLYSSFPARINLSVSYILLSIQSYEVTFTNSFSIHVHVRALHKIMWWCIIYFMVLFLN